MERERRGAPSASFRLNFSVTPGNTHEFDLWRFGLSPLFAMDARVPLARSSFAVEATSYQFADVALSLGSSSGVTLKRTTQTIARSGLDNIAVVVHLIGGCDLNADGLCVDVLAGDIFFLDLSRRSTIEAPDYRSLTIVLPRVSLEPFLPNLDRLHGLVLPRSSPLNTMLLNHLQTLAAEVPGLGLQDARAAARGTAALIAALVSTSSNGRGAPSGTAKIASLQMLRSLVESNLGKPDLGPEFLCRELGMSRATLYRLFEPLGGVSRYIQQRRLTRAFQTITDPAHAGDRVSTIAGRYGFRNDTVFSRAFREAYGMSPTDSRNASGRSDQAEPGVSNDSNFITMNRWLLGLDAAGR